MADVTGDARARRSGPVRGDDRERRARTAGVAGGRFAGAVDGAAADCDTARLAELVRRDPAMTAHVMADGRVTDLSGRDEGRLRCSRRSAGSVSRRSRRSCSPSPARRACSRCRASRPRCKASFAARARDRPVRAGDREGAALDRRCRVPRGAVSRFRSARAHAGARRSRRRRAITMTCLQRSKPRTPRSARGWSRRWSMPAKVAEAVDRHHVPTGCELATIVALADDFAHGREVTSRVRGGTQSLSRRPRGDRQARRRYRGDREGDRVTEQKLRRRRDRQRPRRPEGGRAGGEGQGERRRDRRRRARSAARACTAGRFPSKTLRETAVALGLLRRRSAGVLDVQPPDDLKLASLMTRLDEVVTAHEASSPTSSQRNGIAHWHGRARFVSPHVIEVRVAGRFDQARARHSSS